MSSPTLRILRRSLRLPQLKQGGTLSIAASRLVPGTCTKDSADKQQIPSVPNIPPLTVRIVPGWRDDAEIELWQQIFVQDAGDFKAPSSAASANGGEMSNRHLTDGLVVGLSARINGNDDEHPSTAVSFTDGADSAALNALGRQSGDVSLHLGLASMLQLPSNDDQSPADDIDVHDMEIPVELEDDDDDDDDEYVEEVRGSDDGNIAGNAQNDSKITNAVDDIFECSDDHGLNSLTLIANVPEKVNLKCHLEGEGNIIVEGKVEGQHGFDLRAAAGNIKVKKLRGDSVRLFAGAGAGAKAGTGDRRPTGIVYATDLVEAQTVSIEAEGRMRAKMVNGTNINLSISNATTSGGGSDEDGDGKSTTSTSMTTTYNKPLEVDDTGALIDIGSLYTTKNGNGANVEVLATSKVGSSEVPRAVRIKSSHGHLSVASTLCESAIENNTDEFDQKIPIVELGGVNGSCDVIINSDTTDEEAAASQCPEDECLSTRIHVDSLTPDSVSLVSAGYGNIELTVDRKVEADLRLVSTPNVSAIDADALLVDDEVGVRKECERLDNLSSTNTAAENDPTSVITGADSNRIYVQTNSFSQDHIASLPHGTEYIEGSIHNRSFEPDSRFDVKTKHSSAAGGADVNMGIGKVNRMGAAAQALAGFSGKGGGEQSPLFAVASSGSIKVETVSWFGAIARRYGMDDRRKDVGRTASREGRLK